MNTEKVFIFLSVWRTKKMNKDHLSIFLSCRRTKKMDIDQLSMSTRKKGRPLFKKPPLSLFLDVMFCVGFAFMAGFLTDI